MKAFDHEKLAALRKDLGMTLHQLAQKVGCQAQQIQAWETGKYEPTLRFAVALSKELGVQMDFFLKTATTQEVGKVEAANVG